ncbi:glycosyltransferase family 39 protein [Candidatus Falkowbacteria bacterium]|nr:glycosyltransferase family 39 protein [Candidatus Falkowbacteria bacterium]
MYSITKWIKGNRAETALIFFAVIFFFIYSWFYLGTAAATAKFNSPDEAANYFFIKNYVVSGTLKVFEPLNLTTGGMIHPRSIAVVGGYLVPGSFLGLILIYGWLAKIFTLGVVWWLTPFFASAAVFCFYGIVKNIFDRRVALWSSFLFLVHPAFWYYASRGLFPNILFVSLILAGFYFLVGHKKSKTLVLNYLDYILAGLFFGLALTVRLSEIIWVGAALFILFLIYRKNVKWSELIIFILSAGIAFIPIFIYNRTIYGEPLTTAYNLGEGSPAGGGAAWLVSAAKFIFPFGLEIKNVLKNFSTYFVGMFWWFAIPAAFSVAVFIKRLIAGKLDKKIKIYLLVGGFVSLFLFLYYGSWFFYDNPAKEASIGTSYVRYWLPIYILSLPLVAFTLIKLVDFIRPLKQKLFAAVLCLIFILFGVKLTFFDKNDGLAYVYKNVHDYAAIAKSVDLFIPSEAVIIVDRADKIFFPEHRVVSPLRDDSTYALIPELAKILPLYYYGLPLTEKEMDYLYDGRINKEEIKIIEIKNFGAESLYQLKYLK